MYRFDEFQIDARKRLLLRQGEPVTLNSKAFDVLLALAASGGREVSKDDLMQQVWGEQIVEENNLAVHIYNLRKTLGERKDEHRYIITVPGVGYRFVADVRETPPEAEELFIESHTISRIVVEAEEGEQPIVEASSSRTVRADGIVAAALLSSLPETEAAMRTSLAPLVSSPRRLSLSLVAALAGLFLIAAVGSYWLYRTFSRASVSQLPSSASHGQITITRVSNNGRVGNAAISPDGKFIAYKQNASAGAGTLYVQQTDTNTVLQLLEPNDRVIGCINFSPDSSLIYYVVFDKRDPYGALYSVPVLGGTPKRLMGNFSAYFSVSPDGKRVAFYRDDNQNKQSSLMTATLDGSSEQTLLTRSDNEFSFGAGSVRGLAWSPDGNLIAFSASPEPNNLAPDYTIFAVEVNSGAMKRLTTEPFSSVGKISWTGDGRNLAFVAKRPRGENQLYLMDYPSGDVRQITNEVGIYGAGGLGVTADSATLVADLYERKEEIWSVEADGDASKAVRVRSGTTNGRLGITTLPDGRIAYIARIGDNVDIWAAKEDGTQARALTTDSFIQKDIAASPDGRYLVFTSDSAGSNHIFRLNADDGSEVTQLTFGATSDSHPDVSLDGQWVIYAASDGRQTTIWKVPITGGASLQVTDYESGMPVFAPDGKTFACVLPSDSRAKLSTIAIVATEGGKPLKAFPVKPYQGYHFPVRWTPDGKTIAFGNWQNNVFNLWQQPLSGDAPRQLTNFASGSIWNFAYSRDGKRLFLSRGTTFIDVVVIKNFR